METSEGINIGKEETTRKTFRLAKSLIEEVDRSVPNLRGNLSAQVKHILSIGLTKAKDFPDHEEINKLVDTMDAIHLELRRIGNNINQVAYQLNAGDQPNQKEFFKAASELQFQLATINKLMRTGK